MSHVVGSILASALLILGVVALGLKLATFRRARAAHAAVFATVLGTIGVVAVFGIAAFAQPAIGNAFLSGIEGAQSFYDDVFDAATFAVAVPAALRFSTGIVLLGWATATAVSRWTAVSLGLSGPLIGVIGIAIGPAQTLGSALLFMSGVAIARRFGSRIEVGHGDV